MAPTVADGRPATKEYLSALRQLCSRHQQKKLTLDDAYSLLGFGRLIIDCRCTNPFTHSAAPS